MANPLADGAEGAFVAAAHDAGAVPVFADADGDFGFVEFGAEFAEAFDELVSSAVHAVADGFGTEVGAVDDV